MTSKKYAIGDVVDLDDVLITPAVRDAWQAHARALGSAIPVRPEDIPDERGLWHASGELEIFIEIPNVVRISMKVPPDQWTWR